MTIKQRQVLLAVLWVALVINAIAIIPNLIEGDWLALLSNVAIATGAATILIALRTEK